MVAFGEASCRVMSPGGKPFTTWKGRKTTNVKLARSTLPLKRSLRKFSTVSLKSWLEFRNHSIWSGTILSSNNLIVSAPDKQARLFGGQDFQVTFQALKERRNVLERRSSGAERKKSNMETLKGPILPINNGATNGGTLNPASGASRNRGKAPKPKVTSIDFNTGNHGGGPGGGAMNQVIMYL